MDRPFHGGDDSVRAAYEWLAAQNKTKRPLHRARALKHLIERWAGHYVAVADVEVAAYLLGLLGEYPYFNIAWRMTEPAHRRFANLANADAHPGYRERFRQDAYASAEA